jgi:hypothetical protein
MPVRYEDKNVKTYSPNDADDKPVTGWTNELTREFQTKGYVVLRNFIPKAIIDMTMDSWMTIEHNEEWNDMIFEREEDIIHDSPEESLRKSQGCHTFPPAVALHRWLRDNLDTVIDMDLVETYSYSRKYDRGAYLKAHSDRPSCEVSATICLKYKTDDNTPWKIWVQGDKNYVKLARGDGQDKFFEEMQNVPQHERTGTPVSLEVGDVLLYQGPNIPHWRDYLLGDYSYHMFLHFVNQGGSIVHLDKFNINHYVEEKQESGDKRARSTFAYDGRKTRYHPSKEQQDYFSKAMDFWNEWSSGMHDWFNPEDFINDYSHLEDVELSERERKKLGIESVNEELLRFFKTAYCFTDSQRNKSYEDWISENVKDKVVIDLGAGSGILCYLAVKYGAKKVYALERRGELIDRMKETLGDSVEYIHGDLLETELPECDIYLHEWLTSEFWNEKRFLKDRFYQEGDKELEVGQILDLVEYATKNNFIDKLYPNMVELSEIDGESITEWADINIPSHSKYSRKFLEDYYGNVTQNSIYRNKIIDKKIVWKGHIRDLKYHKVENYLGWEMSFDNNHVLSNHLPISHWGLRHGETI